MHWVTKPGTSIRRRSASPPRPAKELQADPGRAQLRRPHRPGPARRRGRTASTSARTGSASTRRPTTTRRWPRSRRSSTATRAAARRADLPEGAHPGGADRRRARRSSSASTATTSTSCARRRTRSRSSLRGVDGVDRGARRAARPTCPRSRSRSTWRRPSGTASSRATCAAPPSTLIAGEEVGDIFRDGKAYDVQVWSMPETRSSLDDIRQPAASTRRRGSGAARPTSPTVEVAADPERHPPRGPARGASTSAPTSKGRDLGSVADEVQDRLDEVDFPLGYHAELLGEYKERQSRTGPAAASSADRRASGSSCSSWSSSAASGWRCCRSSPCPSALVGGVLAAYWFGGDHLARLAGRLLHRPRHRRPQRHHADQPLPAPGARGGRAVRSGPGHPGREGAARADPDDRADDRARAGPAAAGRATSPGRRSSTRWRSSSWAAWSLDAAQPVRRARRCTCSSARAGRSGGSSGWPLG